MLVIPTWLHSQKKPPSKQESTVRSMVPVAAAS